MSNELLFIDFFMRVDPKEELIDILDSKISQIFGNIPLGRGLHCISAKVTTNPELAVDQSQN